MGIGTSGNILRALSYTLAVPTLHFLIKDDEESF